jgi:hypothetical protein
MAFKQFVKIKKIFGFAISVRLLVSQLVTATTDGIGGWNDVPQLGEI